MIEVDGSGPKGLGDVGDAVFAQDVEGEAARSGHDAWIVADAASVLVAGDVADPMVPVLDAPMLADNLGPGSGRESGGGGNVDGNLAAFLPQAGGGRAQQGAAGDADDGFDEGLPLGIGQGVADGEGLDGAILLAGAPFAARERGVDGGRGGGDGRNDVKQAGLVGLDLDQQVVARLPRNLEGFFDSAWRPG